MTNYTYKIKKGVKKTIDITVKNASKGTGIDLTGSTILVEIRDELRDECPLISKNITATSDITTVGKITNVTSGKFSIKITDDDYDKLVVSRIYYMSIWLIKDNGNYSEVISSSGCDQLQFMVCYP